MSGTDSTTAARWVDDEATYAALIQEWLDEPRVAIDTEFHRERTYWPQCALVQIRWRDQIALVDPLAVDVAALAPVLTGRVVVMHAAGQDLELFQHHVGTVPDQLFDTQIAASFVGMSSIGLAPLVQQRLGIKLPKADRLTDWLARPLSATACAYAASDVAHLFELHDQLTAEIAERGREQWLADECASFVTRTVTTSEPDTAWWRVKEARRLRGRAAAIAQEVAKWRERHAASVDRPLRSVLPDLALAGVAQRPPRSVEDLLKIRGLRDRGIPKAVRGDLLAAVEEGRALDLDRVRFPESRPLASDLRAALPLLTAWIAQQSHDLALDPAVVATRADIEAFLRGDENARLATGWRAEALASDIEGFLAGRSALSFERGHGLVLRSLGA